MNPNRRELVERASSSPMSDRSDVKVDVTFDEDVRRARAAQWNSPFA
jgi:hypothetical protein